MAERFQDWLTATGRTQAGFAQELGVRKQTVNNWCLGKNAPESKMLRRILATYVGLDLGSFVWRR